MQCHVILPDLLYVRHYAVIPGIRLSHLVKMFVRWISTGRLGKCMVKVQRREYEKTVSVVQRIQD